MISAADDYATIRTRIAEIAASEQQICPHNRSTSLYACLRSSARCQIDCPLHGDWIGPQP